jgi:hypothetical protein
MHALTKREELVRLRKESLSCPTIAKDHIGMRPKSVRKTALACMADLFLKQQTSHAAPGYEKALLT